MSNTSNDRVIDAALTSVARLATLPEISARILAVVDNPDATADDIEQLVASDPVLSARLMKVVNSAFYGRSASILSIRQAVVILGMSAVRNIALAASLGKMLRVKTRNSRFDPQEIWTHSLTVAAAARLIGQHIRGDAEELFLIGLLHDIGTVIQLQAMWPKFTELLESRRNDADERFRDAELRILGVSHDELGLALCRKWKFPESIQAGVGFHHDPDALHGELRRIAQIVSVADSLSVELREGYCCAASPRVPATAAAELGLGAATLDQVRARLPEAARLAEQLFA